MSPDSPDDAAPERPRSRVRILGAGVLGVAVLLVALRLGPSSPATPDFEADGPALALPSAQLVPTTLAEFEGILVGLRGQPVIVNIWASWCAPCRAEMPLLQRAADEYSGEVTVLGVDSRDSTGPAADFLNDVGVDYPNVFDRTGAIRKALGLRGFPTTYFIDRRGKIVATVVGGITEARLAAQLEAVL